MAFHEIRLDPLVMYNSFSGPSYRTSVIELPSGDEQRVGWWGNGRKKWKLSKEDLTRDDVVNLEAFFRGRKGRLHGFRLRDWNSWIQTDAPTGVIDSTHGQLEFYYIDATGTVEIQKVTKPVLSADVNTDPNDLLYAPDITLKRDGVAWASGGNWTIDRTTGIITYSTSQTGHTITWSGSYDWPVRFDTDEAMFNRQALDMHDWTEITFIELKQS